MREAQHDTGAEEKIVPSRLPLGISHSVLSAGRAVKEGGRGPTIWDTFAHTSGKVANGDTGDVADDFYHLFPQDIGLMNGLGLKAFRFSVAWSRIFPNGKGKPNQMGIDFYNRLVDAFFAADIEPYCTLFQWDLPQALQDTGGWENRDTGKAFADYAGFTAGFLSDRVKQFITMNEMRTFVELGYGQGIHAPVVALSPKRLAQMTHYVVLAQACPSRRFARTQRAALRSASQTTSKLLPRLSSHRATSKPLARPCANRMPCT